MPRKRLVSSTTLAAAIVLSATIQAQVRSRPSVRAKLQAVESVRPVIDSPLAANPDAVFAIAEGRRLLLTRPSDLSRPWQVFKTDGEFELLAGIAVNGGTLYASDSSLEAVFAIDIATGRRTQLSMDGVLDDPSSIAIAKDVFVADNADGKVYRFRESKMSEVVLEDVGERHPLSLVGSGDSLFIAASDGQISEFRGIGSADPAEPRTPSRRAGKVERPTGGLTFAVHRRAMRSLQDPSRIAVSHGIVYVIDRATKQLNALSMTDGHPLAVAYGGRTRTTPPTSVAANDSYLYVLSGQTLERWPRVVPARVMLRTAGASEAMAQVYQYLLMKNLLTLRQVPLDKTIETTLLAQKVLVDNYPHAAFDPLICRWNQGVCDEKGQMKALAQDAPVWVPDIHSESFVDTAPVILNGKETLGEVVDKRIQSAGLSVWKSEERLKDLNVAELGKHDATQARQVRDGTYLTPIEYVQYLIPIIADDAPPRGALRAIETAFTGVRIISLEERPALGQHAAGVGGVGPSFADLKAMFDKMLGRVSYERVDAARWVTKIGVAERGPLDVNHPDLAGALIDLTSGEPLAVTRTPDGDFVVQTKATMKDHATMVAGLIGARTSRFESKGLAPLAFLVPFDGNDPAIGEGVLKAQNIGVRFFNISEHFGPFVQSASLSAMVKPDSKESSSLFIVAAGNDSSQVCGQFSVYPACWFQEKNVLVVAAMNDTDDDLRKDSNFSATAVHLAAPGAGYYAAGEGRSYVPAEGTSFATPLVTAAAALLYYGVGLTDPWLIKQRLVATADPLPDRNTRNVLGGRLNIRKALHEPAFGVLTRPAAGTPGRIEEQLITLNQDPVITIRKSDNTIDQIRVQALRRVHRQDNGKYRILYVFKNQLQVEADVTFPNDRPGADSFLAMTNDNRRFLVELSRWNDYVAPALVAP